MARRKTLDKWIHEAINDPEKDGKCTGIALLHLVGMQTKEVYSVTLKGTSNWEPKALAELFQDKASAFCQDMQGVQQFNLVVFYANRTEPEATHHFVINNIEAQQVGLGTEPPTETGRTMQFMRQSEMIFQQTYRKQQHLDDATMRFIQLQSNMIDGLLTRYNDAFSVLEEIRIRQLDGDHTRKMAELEYQRKTEERKRWLQYAPALVNTVLGREVFPQNTADTALVETIIDNLKEEDIGKLAGVIPPEIVGTLGQRIQEHLAKKAKIAEDTRQLPRYQGPPEKDVVGGE